MNHACLRFLQLDEDQCSHDNGGCQQICINLIPGYNCSCDPGYTLNEDGRTCDGKNIAYNYVCIVTMIFLADQMWMSVLASLAIIPV